MPALALEGVHHRFGPLEAVAGLSLAIEAGELVCLLGPSGCGKTTVLRLAAGLEPLQQGSVSIGGEIVAGQVPDGRLRDLPPEARDLGLVFQDFALFPHLSVTDNVAFGLRDLPRAARRARAEEMLAQVRLTDFAQAFPHTLSGGQQQRVALARALAPAPKVMLLDEPFSGLDVGLRRDVRDETLHVLKRSGVATLMVTHDPEEAMFMADRIALMRAGRVEQLGAPSELYFKPANRFAAGFFGEVNAIPGEVRGGQVATALGPVDAAGFPEGSRVEVLIRSEGLMLSGPGAAPGGPDRMSLARVLAARLLGRTSLVHLAVADGAGRPALHLHARVPGRFLPGEGQDLGVRLDPSLAFVFPAG